MPIFKFQKRRRAKQEEVKLAEIKELQILNAELIKRLMDQSGDTDNDYPTHEAQTNAIIERYNGAATIGNDLVKRIINVSAALQIPDGIELAVDGEGEEIKNSPELHYIQKCCHANALDAGMATFYCRELQKQGQLLLHLIMDDEDNLIKLEYMPWNVYKYKVKSNGLNNLMPPYEVTWTTENNEEHKLSGDEVVFITMNTTIDQYGYIEGWPALGSVLNRIDAISKDLKNWRQSNRIYSFPTPHVECGERERPKQVSDRIKETGWTVGQMLITSGKFSMVVPQNYYQTLSEAIVFNLKLISGGTGIAISWLGFPDLMSNRATAGSMGEPIEIASSSDITAWKTFFLQMFNQMIRIRNEKLKTSESNQLQPDKVVAKIRPISDRQWKILTEVFMPAAKGNLLTVEGFLERIPDFDYEAELKRREKKAKEEEKKAKERAALQTPPDDRADDDPLAPEQPERGSNIRIRQGRSSLLNDKDERANR